MIYFKFLLKNIDKLLAGLVKQEKPTRMAAGSSTLAPVCLSAILHILINPL
jgi:hypothetical protein